MLSDMRELLRHRYATAILLMLIVLVGLILRIHNISPYLPYPDSYHSLIAAERLGQGEPIIGPLGPDGTSYPPSVWWTRPWYASLIALVSLSGVSPVQAAQIISLLLSMFSILLIYAVSQLIWKHRSVSLAAAGLLAVSFNHVVWSGFVLTEATATFMLLASLYTLLRAFQRPSTARLVFAGLVFGLAIWTRYEYVLLAIPYLILAWQHLRTLLYVRTFIPATLLTLITGAAIWRPFNFTSSELWSQLGNFVILLSVIAFVAIICWVIRTYRRIVSLRFLNASRLWQYLPFVLGGLAGSVIIAAITGYSLPYFSSTNTFFIHELPLLPLLILSSLAARRTREARRILGVFSLAIILLLAAYLRVNADMERYLTHVLPLVILMASFGAIISLRLIEALPKAKRQLSIAACSIVVIGQLFISFNGIHNWQDGLWFQPGYEELSAQKLPPIPANSLIITATPEPYYLATHHGIITPFTAPPYLELPQSVDHHTPVIVVADESMRRYFPEVYDTVTQKLQVYQIDSYFLQVPFRDGSDIIAEQNPVRVYRLPLDHIPSQLTRQ